VKKHFQSTINVFKSAKRGLEALFVVAINVALGGAQAIARTFGFTKRPFTVKARLRALLGGAVGSALVGGQAFAQAAGNTIGGQVQSMATEFSTASGFAGSTAMYAAALICFIAGVWYLWKSRQPENRESGNVAAGAAGLVLTGLFVAGGAWINKAAQTTSGGAATITSTAAAVTFQ